jgi:hypothetical protein
MAPSKNPNAQAPPACEQHESWVIDSINVLLGAPQGSAQQQRAGRRLLELIFDDIDQLCRRRYLPEDESEQAALRVVERLQRNNYHNLRAFVRWRSVIDRSEVRPLQQLRAMPAHTFDAWLRRLCRWEVRRRLRPYCNASSLDELDVSALPDPDVPFAEEVLIERELRGQEGATMDLALEALDGRQRAALRLYAQSRDEAIPKGERQARTKLCYTEMAPALGLRDAAEAADFVRVARQRLRRALRRLYSPAPRKS